MKKKPARKNPVAKTLAADAFKQRVVADKKKAAPKKKPKWLPPSDAEG